MNSIHANFLPENHYWLRDVPKEDFYLYLEIEGIQPQVSNKRVPLNLALVIDRSGSMEGAKIDYAKKAMQFVVKNLGPEDCISLVQYDDEIDVLSPSAQVKNKEELIRKIESVFACDMTNLSGGMLEGYRQVGSTQASGAVNRVLLLSDGLANLGITDPAALQKIAQEKFRNEGIALSTFGVGADFDELLMTSMSEYGGGNYYFIDSAEKIPAIFARELDGLLAVVAQGSTLEVHCPDGFTCEKVFGYPYEAIHQGVRVRFNDVFATEKKAVLIKMRAAGPPNSDFTFRAHLSYFDAIASGGLVQEQQEIRVRLVSDNELMKSGVEHQVAEQRAVFIAGELMEAAAKCTEGGNPEKGTELLKQAIALIELQLVNTPQSTVLQKLLSRISSQISFHQDYFSYTLEERQLVTKTTRSEAYLFKRKMEE
ncbi:MAG: vWA domain-containing protein [Saprospiraceae bacterium]